MSVIDIDELNATASPVLALAEQLRDGPLQELIDLQMRANELAVRIAANPGHHLDELAELVRISLAAMERFRGFTLEFRNLLQQLADANRPNH
jgi:hypothetical protein